ncbi:hypothetical protein BGZ82_008359 [Podila clonocystis]|nr:hypothetical protein BGZ82_008359 [Podila clonocystis]
MGPSDTANDTSAIACWDHNQAPETAFMPPRRTSQQGDVDASAASKETYPDDRDLYNRICEILSASSRPPLEKSSALAVILYSDTFCPILKYHSQLISELATAIPTLLQKSIDRENPFHHIQTDIARSPDTLESSTLGDTSAANVLTMILSPKSDQFIRGALAMPFQLDLFDRMRLARIQITEAFSHLEIPLLLDDSFGQLQDRNKIPFNKSQPNQSIQLETERLQTILARVATAHGRDALELVTVLEQSQTDLYGIPVDLPGKVVYVVTRRTPDKARAKVASTVRWVDRAFLKTGYSSEWISANLLIVYARIDTEGVNEREEAGEDWDSEDSDEEDEIQVPLECSLETEKYLEEVVYLSDMRPEEAKVRVMVKQNRGESVFEPGVLAQVQRSKLFEMQAIRKPRFSQMMNGLSLDNSASAGQHNSNDLHHEHHHSNSNNDNHDENNHNNNHSNNSNYHHINNGQAPSAPLNPFL